MLFFFVQADPRAKQSRWWIVQALQHKPDDECNCGHAAHELNGPCLQVVAMEEAWKKKRLA